MKLKDIMPFTNEQLAKKLDEISANGTTKKNISDSNSSSEIQKILKAYDKIIVGGYEKLKKNELDLLQLIMFRIENDPEYVPSPNIVALATSAV